MTHVAEGDELAPGAICAMMRDEPCFHTVNGPEECHDYLHTEDLIVSVTSRLFGGLLDNVYVLSTRSTGWVKLYGTSSSCYREDIVVVVPVR